MILGRLERQLEALARQKPDVVPLRTVPGIGLIAADLLVTAIWLRPARETGTCGWLDADATPCTRILPRT